MAVIHPNPKPSDPEPFTDKCTAAKQLRNVNADSPITAFPAAAARVAERLKRLPDVGDVDQLTVNEYGPGVGLSSHVDTHSAFTGSP